MLKEHLEPGRFIRVADCVDGEIVLLIHNVIYEYKSRICDRRFDAIALVSAVSDGYQDTKWWVALEIYVTHGKDKEFVREMIEHEIDVLEFDGSTVDAFDVFFLESLYRNKWWKLNWADDNAFCQHCEKELSVRGATLCKKCTAKTVCPTKGCDEKKDIDHRKCKTCLTCPECGSGVVPYKCRMCKSCSEERAQKRLEEWKNWSPDYVHNGEWY